MNWLKQTAKSLIIRTPLITLFKRRCESAWWAEELPEFVRWYNGETPDLRSLAAPTAAQKVAVRELKDSAILTWTE